MTGLNMMTNKPEDPAFPHLRRHIKANTYEPLSGGGMSIRTYLAGRAMQGLLSDYKTIEKISRSDKGLLTVIIGDSLEFADALIAELNKD